MAMKTIPVLDRSAPAHDELWRLLFENAPDAMLVLTPDGVIADGNRKAFALFGLPRKEDLAGKTPLEFSLRVLSSGENAAEKAKLVIGRALGGDDQFFEWEHVQADGSIINVEISITRIRAEAGLRALAIVRDVTARKHMEEALQKSEQLFRSIIENAPFGAHLYKLEQDDRLIFIGNNPAADRILGIHNAQFVGRTIEEVFPALANTAVPEAYRAVIRTGKICDEEQVRYDAQGISGAYEVRAFPAGARRLAVFFSDITERKKIEVNLKESQRQLAALLSNMPGMAYRCRNDRDWTMEFVSLGGVELTGYQPAELVGSAVASYASLIHPDDRDSVWTGVQRALAEQKPFQTTYRIKTRDGREKWVWEQGRGVFGSEGQLVMIEGIVVDITGQKIAEDALRRSEENYRTIIETANEGIWTLDENHVTVYVNHKMAEMLGYRPEEMTGCTVEGFIPSEDQEDHRKKQAERTAGKAAVYERRFLHRDGSVRWMQVSATPLLDQQGRFKGSFAMFNDITDQKHAEEALRQSEEKYRRIIDTANEGIVAIDTNQVVVYVNQKLAEMVGARPDDLVGRPVVEFMPPEELKNHQAKVDDRHAGQRGHYERRFRRRDGSTGWLQVSASPVMDDTGKPAGSFAMVNDITDQKNYQGKIRAAYDRLKSTMDGIITSLSHIVEMRDPYTAGHQRHVSQLAHALAREMGLSEGRANGIRIAGLIHDVGKIHVPSDILSKPGRLSAVEFNLIRVHPRAGYDMLRFIDFPWPVAEVAHEHHERIDGSGYPQGLKGDAIRLETRIVSVADTVEAMTFHRPYRPEIGIEKALVEIEGNKGSLYDSAVVDACRKLFRENRFTFAD